MGGVTMTTVLKPLPEAYGQTLANLHRLAVYVVSPAQRLVNGEIILQSTHGGFSTFEYGGHVTRIVDDRLAVDLASAAVLADWFEFATEALEALRAGARPGDDATIVRIWPEHFDAAIDMGDADAGRRATYGGSPGDRHHAEPYLYASPWAGRIDPFFDDPTFKGASLTYAELLAAADPQHAASEFLEEARRRIAGATVG